VRFLPLLLLLGCAAKKTTMSGIADDKVYFDGWVPVKVHNAPDGRTWVRLNNHQLKKLKNGSRVVFHVQAISVHNPNDTQIGDIVTWAKENYGKTEKKE
tara:strand:- start:256 stop:552 length:297 start_codon:yes stop_codon:yes gene_type:complete